MTGLQFARLTIFFTSTCICMCACVPVEPAEERLVGTWRVQRECGKETLELHADRTYVQSIEYAAGGRASHSGPSWKTKPATSRLDGGRLVLHDAVMLCSMTGEKLTQPQSVPQLELATIWEWGRMTLSFDPDLAGFVRQ